MIRLTFQSAVQATLAKHAALDDPYELILMDECQPLYNRTAEQFCQDPILAGQLVTHVMDGHPASLYSLMIGGNHVGAIWVWRISDGPVVKIISSY